MSVIFPSQQEQETVFNYMRDQIDLELRNTGFVDYLAHLGMNAEDGTLIVARGFIYSSDFDGKPADTDPFSQRLVTTHQVGIMRGSLSGSWAYSGIRVSSALHGEYQVPVNGKLDGVQIATVEGAIHRLLIARQCLLLPFLTKSLKKIDLAGD